MSNTAMQLIKGLNKQTNKDLLRFCSKQKMLLTFLASKGIEAICPKSLQPERQLSFDANA